MNITSLISVFVLSSVAACTCTTAVHPTGGDDTAMLQSATDSLDATCPNGGTIDLGDGTYNIKTWKVASSRRQHHINIVGVNPNATVIQCGAADGQACIYLNVEKYVTVRDFTVTRQDGHKWGIGIAFGGDLASGTQSNGNLVQHVRFSNLHYGVFTSGGSGTSSELEFDQPIFQNNVYGFYSANFNALNFQFTLPEFYGNQTGFYISTGNAEIHGGASANNGTDFYIAGGNDGQVKISGFRAETPSGDWLVHAAIQYLEIDNCIVHPRAPGVEVILDNPGGNLTVRNSTLNGYITWSGFPNSQLTLDNVSVNTPGTDWSLTNQMSKAYPPYGPGFRFTNNQNAQPNSEVRIEHVYEAATNSFYPDIHGIQATRSDHMRTIKVVSQP